MKPVLTNIAQLTFLRAAAIVLFAGYAFLPGDISAKAQVAVQKTPEADPKDMTIIGRVERVWIAGANIVLRAKIDTGARTTSLHTTKIETFKRRAKDWVRFSILNKDGKPITLERKVLKFQKIKKKHSSDLDVRPVVLLGLCISDVYRLSQVNLFDRGKFAFPVLIGRRFLFAKVLVNVERIYTSEPRCNEMKAG